MSTQRTLLALPNIQTNIDEIKHELKDKTSTEND